MLHRNRQSEQAHLGGVSSMTSGLALLDVDCIGCHTLRCIYLKLLAT